MEKFEKILSWTANGTAIAGQIVFERSHIMEFNEATEKHKKPYFLIKGYINGLGIEVVHLLCYESEILEALASMENKLDILVEENITNKLQNQVIKELEKRDFKEA